VSTVHAVDLFCGAGGTSTGLLRACHRLGRSVDLLAVNHWKEAMETHALNHTGVRHLHEDLGVVDPRHAVPGGRLDLLLASPECTSHSYSRGGRPISEQSRATAWHPLRWADQLRIDALVIENVPAFRSWGPTDRRGRQIPSRRGETYRQYLDMLRAMGYTVDARVLNAADFGGATTRKRLFILALKGPRAVRWPMASHAPSGDLPNGKLPWRAAREIIDWSVPGKSIFQRSKPLARATRERILIGLAKFGGPELAPYLVILRRHMDAKSVEEPVPALTANGQHVGLAEPFLVNIAHGDNPAGSGRGNGGRVRAVSEPMRTLTGSREHGLVEPFLVKYHGNHQGKDDGMKRSHGLEQPLPTVDGSNRFGLVEPFLVVNRTNNLPRSVDEPLAVLNTGHHMALVEPFILPHRKFTRMDVDSIHDPMRTLTTSSGPALVETVVTDGREAEPVGRPFIVPFMGERPGQRPRTHSIDEPLPTIMSGGAGTRGLVEPFLLKYNRTGGARSVAAPLDTLTTKDRYGLVTGQGIEIGKGLYLDIRFRMLRVHELAGAMGFPTGYQFAGTVDQQVRQVGNAVEVHQAEALCWAVLNR